MGDNKCDGYRVSEKCVFQCYAPEHSEPAKTATKISRDFEGAKRHFGNRMERWVFVYNKADLPTGCGRILGELREANPSIRISFWSQQDLLKLAIRLGPENLAILLTNWHVNIDVGETIRNAIIGFANANTVSNEKAERLAANTNQVTLLQTLDRLSDDDRNIRIRLLGYSKWLYPLTKDHALFLLTEKGYELAIIKQNLDRLDHASLLNVTANHMLPLDDRICSEAADQVADEFLALLEEA